MLTLEDMKARADMQFRRIAVLRARQTISRGSVAERDELARRGKLASALVAEYIGDLDEGHSDDIPQT